MNTIGSILGTIRKEKGLTRKDVSNKLHEVGIDISDKTLYGYESGRTTANADMFLALCKIYGVKDVFTTFGYDGYNEDGTLSLNMYEIDIIEKYRTLDTHGKEMVDFTLDKEYERCAEPKAQRPDISKQRYAVPEINAAHERTDIKITDEMKQYDDDIMDDDDF